MNSTHWPDIDYKTVAKLVLEDGTEYYGYSIGYEGRVGKMDLVKYMSAFCDDAMIEQEVPESEREDLYFKNSKLDHDELIVSGEVIFNTAMVGYNEALTDPSYFGQILVLTYPSVGNYGVPDVKHDEFGIVENFESNRVQVQGLVICEYSRQASHYNSKHSLSAWLWYYKVPCIAGIDTRALTKKLREQGSMLGKIIVHKNGFYEKKYIQKVVRQAIESFHTIGVTTEFPRNIDPCGMTAYMEKFKANEYSSDPEAEEAIEESMSKEEKEKYAIAKMIRMRHAKGIRNTKNPKMTGKGIALFNPGNIDTIKYVCNHHIRVFKFVNLNNHHDSNIKQKSKKNSLKENDEEELEREEQQEQEQEQEEIVQFVEGSYEYKKYLIMIEETAEIHRNLLDEYGFYDMKKVKYPINNYSSSEEEIKEEENETANSPTISVGHTTKDPRKKWNEQYRKEKLKNIKNMSMNMNDDFSTYEQCTMKNEEFLQFINKKDYAEEQIMVIVDCGMKNSMLRQLLTKGKGYPITYVVVPYYYNFTPIEFDSLFISNGPGDPKKCDKLINTLKESLQKNKLVFGICLGNQLLGLALGCETFKMRYGNRGVNQPVIRVEDNKCFITSQNHGYCLKHSSVANHGSLVVSYVNANDKTIEGIAHKNGIFYSVQFHPEGNNGPTDTAFLFKDFVYDMFHLKKEVRIYEVPTIISMKKKVLLLGSGGLCIGQAGEFDYSGTQAIKSLKECGIYVILVNPNIATVQTSKGLADLVYFLPVNSEFVELIIKREKPDFLLCTFGGQTALNCALELERKNVLKENNCYALGTSLETIMVTEDRSKFAEKLKEINEVTAPYGSAREVEEAVNIANRIGYPVLIRTTFSLGGLNSCFINDEAELREKCNELLFQTRNEIFIDKSLKGWKEIEYELLRDRYNNCIAICNMENIDPLGIHTGDSVVVAPSQTLNNEEYYKFREIALKVIRHLNIIGECNIQFGINPKTGEYCIIEVNARLSRSSALASKATGYPLAYVSAKVTLGYDLTGLRNSITKKTTACFEPSLDYITTKIPRWDLNKFEFASNRMNSSMKSVGEVMSIGRTFEESIQKSLRCIDENYMGFCNYYCTKWDRTRIVHELKNPSPKRIDAIHRAFELEMPLKEIHELTDIDYWFLHKFYNIYKMQNMLKKTKLETMSLLDMKFYKKHGFSDKQLAHYLSYKCKVTEEEVRVYREETIGCVPNIKVIDTLSAEFPATTNYLYLTYQGQENDVQPLSSEGRKKIEQADRSLANTFNRTLMPNIELGMESDQVETNDTARTTPSDPFADENENDIDELIMQSNGMNTSVRNILVTMKEMDINNVNGMRGVVQEEHEGIENLNGVANHNSHMFERMIQTSNVGDNMEMVNQISQGNQLIHTNNETLHQLEAAAAASVNPVLPNIRNEEMSPRRSLILQNMGNLSNMNQENQKQFIANLENFVLWQRLRQQQNLPVSPSGGIQEELTNIDGATSAVRRKMGDSIASMMVPCPMNKMESETQEAAQTNINGNANSTKNENTKLYQETNGVAYNEMSMASWDTSTANVVSTKDQSPPVSDDVEKGSKTKSKIKKKEMDKDHHVAVSNTNSPRKDKKNDLFGNHLMEKEKMFSNMQMKKELLEKVKMEEQDETKLESSNVCDTCSLQPCTCYQKRKPEGQPIRMNYVEGELNSVNMEKGNAADANVHNTTKRMKSMMPVENTTTMLNHMNPIDASNNKIKEENGIVQEATTWGENLKDTIEEEKNRKEHIKKREKETVIRSKEKKSPISKSMKSRRSASSKKKHSTQNYCECSDYLRLVNKKVTHDKNNPLNQRRIPSSNQFYRFRSRDYWMNYADQDSEETRADINCVETETYAETESEMNGNTRCRTCSNIRQLFVNDEYEENEEKEDSNESSAKKTSPKTVSSENFVRRTEADKDGVFIVLGCGCYRIGSSVEFDWSAIHCTKTIRKLGHKAIIINCNPETVSTDYDESDRLYFDEISTEVIKFINQFESSEGVIIAFGGQTSNNLVFTLHNAKVKILGTSPESVDACEDRNKFSHLCDSLKIDQPKWNKFTKLSRAINFCEDVKFPVLVRPSYVLSGAAMRVVTSEEELNDFLMKATIVSRDNPVVISKFIENAKEIEIDCVSKAGKIINYAISEHVENAGVHSGDATLILPAQNIYVETHRKIKKISEKISTALNISGPFNIQFLCYQNEIKIIECNLRASRTFPFICKGLNLNFIDLATRIMLGYDVEPVNISLIDVEYTTVKSPFFSFNRLHGSDCILGVEMKSTGEVACFGLNKYEAFLKSLIATGVKLPVNTIMISLKNIHNKVAFEEPFQLLCNMGYTIYATEGTYDYFSKFIENLGHKEGSDVYHKLIKIPNKIKEDETPGYYDLIMHKKTEMVINITDTIQTRVDSDGYKIRRLASDFQVPLITNMKLATLFVDSLYRKYTREMQKKAFYSIKSYDEYIN